MTTLKTELQDRSYNITIGRNLLGNADKYFNLNRRAVIITDSGVPNEYAEQIASLCTKSVIVTVAEGEESKSIATLEHVLSEMTDAKLDRGDCAIAVGGGVVGDLTGFAASIYMRGIDFYNVPTTLLSQVDSSVGGKTAVNFRGIKNIVGSFYQPKAVLIDVDTLKTLPDRQIRNGLAEAIKMSVTSDEELFSLFEKMSAAEIHENLEEIIVRSVMIKKSVVEEDEKESGLRMILNFGHTLAHGIEALEEMKGLYHGECVALGMLPMCSADVRARLISVLKKVGLPTEYSGDVSQALTYAMHDKKRSAGDVSIITSEKIGTCKISKVSTDEFKNIVLEYGF